MTDIESIKIHLANKYGISFQDREDVKDFVDYSDDEISETGKEILSLFCELSH